MRGATIFGMYVAAEQRGKVCGSGVAGNSPGAGTPNAPTCDCLPLDGKHKRPGKALYASVGFETCDIEAQAVFVDGEYFDDELMALKLDSPPGL